MLLILLRQAIEDIRRNLSLSIVTIITIALSVLIVSAFILFFNNVYGILGAWEKGMRIMVYLKSGVTEAQWLEIQSQVERMEGVREATFIAKEKALAHLKAQMKRHSSLFDDLKQNPLPDAFEIQPTFSFKRFEQLENLSREIESLPLVEQVEYGRRWLGRFKSFMKLFKMAGYAMIGLFFMATVFIVANTIRLMLYSRQQEIEIMRLVGAADSFIKAPFYIEGLLQGALGGIIGITALLAAFGILSMYIPQGLATGPAVIRFLSPGLVAIIISASILVGWLGCFLSIKHFLKTEHQR